MYFSHLMITLAEQLEEAILWPSGNQKCNKTIKINEPHAPTISTPGANENQTLDRLLGYER
jgi:hypothetical protein